MSCCGEPAIKQDIHRRWLCDLHYDLWDSKWTSARQRTRTTNKMLRPHRLFISDIDPLDKLIRLLQDDTGTAQDIAECLQGCRWLVKKLKG